MALRHRPLRMRRRGGEALAKWPPRPACRDRMQQRAAVMQQLPLHRDFAATHPQVDNAASLRCRSAQTPPLIDLDFVPARQAALAADPRSARYEQDRKSSCVQQRKGRIEKCKRWCLRKCVACMLPQALPAVSGQRAVIKASAHWKSFVPSCQANYIRQFPHCFAHPLLRLPSKAI